MLRIVEEDVVVRARPVEVEEADIECAQLSLRSDSSVHVKAARSKWRGPKPSLSEARKTATRVTSSVCGKPLHNRIQQRPQIGLRIQAAAELHQSLAIVEPFLVKDPVHPAPGSLASAARR
ncbi:MAG: hypothetical protein WDN23_16345 [Edaphobacter sp.]